MLRQEESCPLSLLIRDRMRLPTACAAPCPRSALLGLEAGLRQCSRDGEPSVAPQPRNGDASTKSSHVHLATSIQ